MQIGEDPSAGYLSNNLWVPKGAVNIEGVKAALTFPVFKGRDHEVLMLTLYRESDHHLVVPREYWRQGTFGFPVFDMRPRSYPKIEFKSRIKLDHLRDEQGVLQPTGLTVQRDSLAAMLASRGGTLQLACGKGKTIVTLEAITRLQVPTLILIDNHQLLMQWQRAIGDAMEDVPGGVGLIGDGEFDWEGRSIVLATYTTMAARRDTIPESFRRWFGTIVFEEGHHLDALTFSKSADLIYGRRYALTATPKREDGMHVVHEFHVGDVFFKDLKQDLKPRIYFYKTGLELNMKDAATIAGTHTEWGDLHLSKLATWFGQWRERMMRILTQINKAVEEDRKVLVLSNSVDELINMLALWNGLDELFTDIVAPELPEGSPPPVELTKPKMAALEQNLEHLRKKLSKANGLAAEQYMKQMAESEFQLEQHRNFQYLAKAKRVLERQYLERLLAMSSNAGLMIHRVDPEERVRMLRDSAVTFAIMKYGREGLDDPAIDTIALCEPIGGQGGIQQTMGRALRPRPRKKTPIFMVFEDDIEIVQAMCKKMRKLMRRWPIDAGGPFQYEVVGYTPSTDTP